MPTLGSNRTRGVTTIRCFIASPFGHSFLNSLRCNSSAIQSWRKLGQLAEITQTTAIRERALIRSAACGYRTLKQYDCIGVAHGESDNTNTLHIRSKASSIKALLTG